MGDWRDWEIGGTERLKRREEIKRLEIGEKNKGEINNVHIGTLCCPSASTFPDAKFFRLNCAKPGPLNRCMCLFPAHWSRYSPNQPPWPSYLPLNDKIKILYVSNMSILECGCPARWSMRWWCLCFFFLPCWPWWKSCIRRVFSQCIILAGELRFHKQML